MQDYVGYCPVVNEFYIFRGQKTSVSKFMSMFDVIFLGEL